MLTQTRDAVAERPGLLANSRVVYLIVYVNDLPESRQFYERRLGLRVVEEDDHSVKLDAGLTMLLLNRASDHGIKLPRQRDDSSDVVFLVEDLEGMRAALEARGVVFARRRTYEVGAVTDFYDPSGHRLMLYEPSRRALAWPSSDKVRAVWRSGGRGGTDLIGPAAVPVAPDRRDWGVRGLDGTPLLYFFVFVKDTTEAADFYETLLGLRVLERTHCCSDLCPGNTKGVMKYDGGGMIVSTHHLHGHHVVVDDHGVPYGARDFEPEHAKGIAPVFHVADAEGTVEELKRRGVSVPKGLGRSPVGNIARVEAPSGHIFYLYEPSAEALRKPSGAKIREILAAQL